MLRTVVDDGRIEESSKGLFREVERSVGEARRLKWKHARFGCRIYSRELSKDSAKTDVRH